MVNVITGVTAPNPVTVCPEIEPKLLAKLEIVCAGGGNGEDVLLIFMIPPVGFAQVGLVNVKVADGFGRTVTDTMAVDGGQLPEAGTVYV